MSWRGVVASWSSAQLPGVAQRVDIPSPAKRRPSSGIERGEPPWCVGTLRLEESARVRPVRPQPSLSIDAVRVEKARVIEPSASGRTGRRVVDARCVAPRDALGVCPHGYAVTGRGVLECSGDGRWERQALVGIDGESWHFSIDGRWRAARTYERLSDAVAAVRAAVEISIQHVWPPCAWDAIASCVDAPVDGIVRAGESRVIPASQQRARACVLPDEREHVEASRALRHAPVAMCIAGLADWTHNAG